MNMEKSVKIYLAPSTGQLLAYNGDDLMLMQGECNVANGGMYPDHAKSLDNYSLHAERNRNSPSLGEIHILGVSLNGEEELELVALESVQHQ